MNAIFFSPQYLLHFIVIHIHIHIERALHIYAHIYRIFEKRVGDVVGQYMLLGAKCTREKKKRDF